MAKQSKRRGNRSSVLRQRLLIAGLVAFLIFDVALVSFALNDTKPSKNAGAVVDPPSVVEPVETTPPAVEPPAVVEPVETTPTTTPPPTRFLAALDATTAWRATTGDCPAATATPERTTDSGATWTSFDASAGGTDASSILSVYVKSKSEVSLVTLTAADCTPQRVSTFVAGDQWQEYPDRVSANWFVNPANRATVHSPAGDFPAPCPSVIALADRNDSTAAVLCADGTLFRTGDGAATWGPGVSLPGAANLTVSDDGYILAATNQAGCAGVQVFSTPEAPDATFSPNGCREAAVAPGDVAVASAGGMLWLWAGDAVSRSDDGGATWQ